MKPRPFSYIAPEGVEDAVAALAEHGDDASVLAGGQSLLPLLNLRLASPSVIIDIGRLDSLASDTTLADGSVRLGSAVTHSAIEDSVVNDPTHGLLPRVAAGIGHRAIRNRGTMGGSLAHADPLAEWPLVMCALGAEVRLRSAKGSRSVPVDDFLVGFLTTDRAPDELCEAVDVPALTPDHSYGFCKLARKTGDFADAMAIAIAHRSSSGPIDALRVWLGCTSERPIRMSETEQVALTNVADGNLQRSTVTETVRVDLDRAGERSDAHRMQMQSVAIRKAVAEAVGAHD